MLEYSSLLKLQKKFSAIPAFFGFFSPHITRWFLAETNSLLLSLPSPSSSNKTKHLWHDHTIRRNQTSASLWATCLNVDLFQFKGIKYPKEERIFFINNLFYSTPLYWLQIFKNNNHAEQKQTMNSCSIMPSLKLYLKRTLQLLKKSFQFLCFLVFPVLA